MWGLNKRRKGQVVLQRLAGGVAMREQGTGSELK